MRRMIVVGDEDAFQKWLFSQPDQQQDVIVPVRRWSQMLGYQTAVVEFMPDWRTHPDRTAEENERILSTAREMATARERLLDPFTHAKPAQPVHDAPTTPVPPSRPKPPQGCPECKRLGPHMAWCSRRYR